VQIGFQSKANIFDSGSSTIHFWSLEPEN
jgi:hypothetical protein